MDYTAFVEEYLDYYAETQCVLPERLGEFGEWYREQGHLRRRRARGDATLSRVRMDATLTRRRPSGNAYPADRERRS
ncbi:hypothetical protein BRC81_03540 [Halobacteriales archaeon QS_1_68_20]|nr:MAG: hypothetical protein BRC81_03540 [Halobacteriales archaeon QS_1_68_20]